MLAFSSLAFLAVGAFASSKFPAPHCTDSTVPLTISATNYELSSGTRPENATVPVSGTFNVHLRFCEPTVFVPHRADTLQVVVHGGTYTVLYNDPSFEPEKYNYVRFAAAHGYATLNMDRLGAGLSDHPDPIALMQTPLDIAALTEILKLARAGHVAGRPFRRIAYVGHSFGSIILNGVVAAAPETVDAAVFTGYSHADGGAAITGVGPARDVDPARFGGLAPGYVTTLNATTRGESLYGAPGTYDARLLAYDEAHKDAVAAGMFLTRTAPVVAAPRFRGDVLTVVGDQDAFYCSLPHCANLADEAAFYPAARSVDYAVIPNTGHLLNFQLAAPSVYAIIQKWLNRHGY